MKTNRSIVQKLDSILWLVATLLTFFNFKLTKDGRLNLSLLVDAIIFLCLMTALAIRFIRRARRIETQEENEKKDEDKGE